MNSILKVPVVSAVLGTMVIVGLDFPGPALAQFGGTPQQVAAQLALERNYPKMRVPRAQAARLYEWGRGPEYRFRKSGVRITTPSRSRGMSRG